MGRSVLNAVRNYLRQMLVCLLKVHGWPDHQAIQHWPEAVSSFQALGGILGAG